MPSVPPCQIKLHRWTKRPRGSGEYCEKCGIHFPCDERDCGHYDCIQERHTTQHNLPICTQCRRKVDAVQATGVITVSEPNGTVLLRYTSIESRGKSKLICEKCLNKQEAV